MRVVGIVLALVVLSTAVATFAKRLRVPAPSLLVLAGLAVALVPGTPAVRIAPETIGLIVLPPLLYAAAEQAPTRELRAVWRPVAGLVLGLVPATALGIAGLTLLVTSTVSVPLAFALGAVLASTDPVAVTAIGRRMPLPPRIQALVQYESLFNDATSLVLFQVAVGVAIGTGALDWTGAGIRFVELTAGGIGIGGVLALLLVALRSRTSDPVLHTVIALITPYAAYMLAEAAHASGVTAVVVAGLVLGGTGHKVTDARSRLHGQAVYAVVDFLLESVVFALIGLQLPTLVRDLPAGSDWWPAQAAALAAALIAIRIAWVWPTVSLAAPTRGHPRWPLTRVVSWSGTRGVMPLAAALTIPLATDDGSPIADRPLVLVLTVAVVAATLAVQGLSLASVVRSSGLALDPARLADSRDRARTVLAEAALGYIDTLDEREQAPPEVLDRLRLRYTARLADGTDTVGRADAYNRIHQRLLGIQNGELHRLYADGEISDGTRRALQRELDRAEAALTEQ
jgi:CPA1 family monovalent cation:H+ antiporter